MKSVIIVKHPLIDHSLTILRDKNTGHEVFRRHAGVVSKLVITEAAKQISLNPIKIETPLTDTNGYEMANDIILVPVLRAGLAMLSSVQDLFPAARVGFVGLERDEKTAVAREYYNKIPNIDPMHEIFILDPMLATGGSFDDAVVILQKRGAKKLTLVCIVAAPEGLRLIQAKHPKVGIYTAAIDDHLNDRKYIVPGLGDFGDRYFGTLV
jgi:uracil phosphoribosyltransferase